MKNALIALATLASIPAAQAHEREGGGRVAARAVQVDFTSPGNGIDTHGRDEVVNLAAQWLKAGKIALITGKRWGREGEFTLCVQSEDFRDTYAFKQAVEPIVGADTSAIRRTRVSLKLGCLPTPAPRPNE